MEKKINIVADSVTKQIFNIQKESLSEQEAKELSIKINNSNKGKAIISENTISILRPIRD